MYLEENIEFDNINNSLGKIVAISSVLRGYFNGKERISITAHSQTIEQILKKNPLLELIKKDDECDNHHRSHCTQSI